MLRLTFFNVGDGDASLYQLIGEDGQSTNILIDSGREVPLSVLPKSKKMLAIEHLRKNNIKKIDLMIITHFHIDHMGGALSVLKEIPVSKMIVPYIPKGTIKAFPSIREDDPFHHKWDEFCHVLSLWEEIIKYAKDHNCEVVTAWDEPKTVIGEMTIKQILPPSEFREQKALYDYFYGTNGKAADHSGELLEPYWHSISEKKNADSTMQLIDYKNCRILSCGDRYAATFEHDNIGHCDILKLPHHGDEKSMTEKLLDNLSPRFAIISCQMDPSQKKKRPYTGTVAMLQDRGIPLYCTENKELENLKEFTCEKIRLDVYDNGEIKAFTE